LKTLATFLAFLIAGCAPAQSTEGFLKINGTSLFVKSFGKGPPLLVIHGGPGLNHSYFLPHLEALATDFHVILYDQRASGASAIPGQDSLRMEFFVHDIDAIRNYFGYEKVNLLAHSWGAILAMQYGLDFPQHVDRMILCNPVALSREFDGITASNQKQRMTRADSVDRASILQSKAFKEGNASAMEKLMMMSFRHSFYDAKNLAKLGLGLQQQFTQASKALYGGLGKDLARYNYYDSLSTMTFPLMVLYGEADVLPLRAVQRIEERNPAARLVPFSKSGHFIFIEEPARFRKELVGFVK